MIFVIIALSSVEIDIRGRNSRQKIFLILGGPLATERRKVKFRSFKPDRKTSKGALPSTKTIASVNFREIKNAKIANLPFNILEEFLLFFWYFSFLAAKPLYNFYKELPAKMEVFRTKPTTLECHVNDPNAPVKWFKKMEIPIDVSSLENQF